MKKLFLLLALLIINISAYSESSLNLSTTLIGSSSEEGIPHYLKANKWGLVDYSIFQSISIADYKYERKFDNGITFEAGSLIALQLDEDPNAMFNELYTEAYYYGMGIFIGKKYVTIGDVPTDLSGGSMMVSENAPPIPKITLGLPEYITIPFTKELVEVKGAVSVGKLQGDRFIDNVLLHEKSLFGQLDTTLGFKLYGGLMHGAMWGGELDGKSLMDVNFENFIKIFFVDPGGSDTLIDGEKLNKLGSHLGTWEFGARGTHHLLDYHLYYQYFFEDGTYQRLWDGRDGMIGIFVEPKELKYINGLGVSFMNTTYQSGSAHEIDGVILGGQDSYYHHYVYKSGWTHLNSVLGNSFFTTSGNDEDLRVSNNRMTITSFMLKGEIPEMIDYKFLISYGEYLTAYSPVSKYSEKEYMFFIYPEVTYKKFSIDNLSLTFGLAFDVGSVSNNWGTILSINWML